jgi:hypothetical protein
MPGAGVLREMALLTSIMVLVTGITDHLLFV